MIQKPLKCKICKTRDPRVTLQRPFCSNPECGIEMLKLLKEKEAKKEKKEWSVKKEKMRVGLMSHSDWQKALQVKINAIVRGVDQNFPCISSGSFAGQKHGGHFYATGGHNSIRFNLNNIWLQNAHQNTYLSGNPIEYRNNLIKLFGEEFCEKEIFTLPLTYPHIKLSITELQEKIEIAKEIMFFQKEGKYVAKTNEERLTIRKELNQKFGIYL